MMKHTLFTTIFCAVLICAGQASAQRAPVAVPRQDTLRLDDFHSINLGLTAVVSVRQGDYQQVIVQGPAALVQDLQRVVDNGVWDIRFKQTAKASDTLFISLVMKRIHLLAISGSGLIMTERPLKLSNTLELSLGGAGMMDLEGIAPEVRINLAGSGKIFAEELEVSNAHISVAGAGEVRLTVIQNLEASIAGSGKVWYSGPAQVRSSVAGSGFVRQIN